MFVMSLLYIVMMFAAPLINPSATYVPLDWSWDHLIPQFNVQYFTSLSILVFAVGGCEKISPYVNKVKDPGKDFPKGMIALAIMVMVCAILGTIAMGMMIPAAEITGDARDMFIANGAYECFQKLGEYYHLGNFFVIVYGACNAIGQFSTLVLSIDAPLRMLLDDESARQFVPKGLLKQNKNGAYINGIILVGILSGSIIAIQLLGTSAADIITWLTRLNSVCMPMRYLWYSLLTSCCAKREANSTATTFSSRIQNWVCSLAAGASLLPQPAASSVFMSLGIHCVPRSILSCHSSYWL